MDRSVCAGRMYVPESGSFGRGVSYRCSNGRIPECEKRCRNQLQCREHPGQGHQGHRAEYSRRLG